MQVKIDLSSLLARAEAARVSFAEEQPAGMKAILDAAAAEDRDGHEYVNRTTNAEASTVAGDLDTTGAAFWCKLGMHVEYAEYLDRRGLTRIVELAEQADSELDYYFDGERDRLAGL
jgi:hypothetical protein